MQHLETILVLTSLVFQMTVATNQVKLLIFETDEDNHASQLLADHANVHGIDATIFGQGSDFAGFSSKYAAVRPLLKAMDDSDIAVLSDGRDVILNQHTKATPSTSANQRIADTFNKLVAGQPNAVVISAEAQCCVAALTYFEPGSLFDGETGARTDRACPSGKPGCLWPEDGDAKKMPWEGFMKSMAHLRQGKPEIDAFLNAGLMAGRPRDLLRLFDALQLDESEDDQAVLTDYLFTNPKSIVLDYDQSLFGNNRWPQKMSGGGCIFNYDEAAHVLVHREKGTTPPFVHSPGKFFECNDKLAEALGQRHVEHAASALRRLTATNYGGATTAVPVSTNFAPQAKQMSMEATVGIIAAIVLGMAIFVGLLVRRRNARREGLNLKMASDLLEDTMSKASNSNGSLSEGDAVSASKVDVENQGGGNKQQKNVLHL